MIVNFASNNKFFLVLADDNFKELVHTKNWESLGFFIEKKFMVSLPEIKCTSKSHEFFRGKTKL